MDSNKIENREAEIIKSVHISNYNEDFDQAKGIHANLKSDNGQSNEVIIFFVEEENKLKILYELEQGNEDFNSTLPEFEKATGLEK